MDQNYVFPLPVGKIWTNFTVKTVIFIAYMLVQAQTIHQNGHILKKVKVFEILLFCNIEICEPTYNSNKKIT